MSTITTGVPRLSRMAVVSFILAFIPGLDIVALVLAVLAIRDIHREGMRGLGFAVVALVLAGLGILAISFSIYAVIAPGTGSSS